MSHLHEHIYIDEVAGHRRRYRRLVDLTHSSTKAAGIMLLCAVIAVVVASTSLAAPVAHFWHTEVIVGFGESLGSMSIAHIINDIGMAIFFLLVGLEIKYEMTVGELTNIRQAMLPIVAALGGVLVPIGIYLAFNASNPQTMGGWGIPTATDIAFALGIIALLGNRIPSGVRVFLSTLAVADDIIAIIVIAVFYGHAPSVFWLVAAGVVLVLLIVLNKTHVYSLVPYLLLGAVLWFCVFQSGVHATIAGVLLAFTIPSGSHVNLRGFVHWSNERIDEAEESYSPDRPVLEQHDYLETVSDLSRVAKQVVPPAVRLEHRLYPWVYFLVLPLFALTNADVSVVPEALAVAASSPVLPGVLLGLVLGKPLGILLFSFVLVKTGVVGLPENVRWGHMLGAAILGGVGFTMSIFVANLAFADAALIAAAKIGILFGSLIAGVAGFLVLLMQARKDEARGVSYLCSPDDSETLLAQDREEVILQKKK